MEIEIRGHHFHLLPQKAIWWQEEKTLLIGDLHLGKITHFRKEGIALPSVAHKNNFLRLDEMIESNDVVRIIMLGDLFHNRFNEEWNVFATWRKKHSSIVVDVVLGNHDILPRILFDENHLGVFEELSTENFIFTHHPRQIPERDKVVFSGHIHPVHCLRTPAKQSIKFPCFVIDELQVVLPSFGVFTGGFEMKKQSNRKIYVIAEKQVIPV